MSQSLNNTLLLVRTGVFGVVSLFALISIALAAIVTHWTSTYLLYGSYFTFAALAIATGILTLFTLPVMLFLGMNRKGAVTSMVVVEIAWTWFLWIMWVSVGGSSAGVVWLGSCSDGGSFFETACRSSQALTAFGFLSWVALLFYNIFLLSLAIRQHLRGYTGIWTSYVTEVDFTAPPVSGTTSGFAAGGFNSYPVQTPEVKVAAFAPQYPPTGTPTTGTPTVAYTGQPMASNYPQPQV